MRVVAAEGRPHGVSGRGGRSGWHEAGAALEGLEGRTLLAAVAWDGGGDGTSWHDPLNWDNNAIPTVMDDVTIDVGGTPTITYTSTTGSRAVNSLLTREALTFSGGTLTVTSTATADSAVVHLNGGTWSGGTWSGMNGAQFFAGAGTLSGITLNTNLTIDEGQALTVRSGLTLNGVLTIGAGVGLNTTLQFGSGTQTLGGTGQVVLGTGALLHHFRLGSGGATDLTIGPGITIRGRGDITQTAPGGSILRNQGTIVADGAGGLTLSIVADSTWTNTGSLGTNAGRLQIQGAYTTDFLNTATFSRVGGTVDLEGALNNTGETLALAANTGNWNLNGVTITGGTITGSGGAQLVTNVFAGTLLGVTLNTDLSITTGVSVVVDDLVLNATVFVTASGQNTSLAFRSGTHTLTGTGQIWLSTGGAFPAAVLLGSGGATTLTVGPGITIRGDGNIRQTGTGSVFNNQGTILADRAADTLNIEAEAVFTNTGVLGTDNGGILTFLGNYTTAFLNVGTFSRMGTGGAVNLSGALDNSAATLMLGANTGDWNLTGTINGGTVSSGSGAQLVVTTNSAVLSGVTMNANVRVPNSAVLTISNGLTLNGEINVDPTSSATLQFSAGTQSLLGTGAVRLSTPGSGTGQVRLGSGGATTLTVGPGITIHGRGAINEITAGSVLNNQGTIVADVSGQALTITASSGWTNTGSLGTNAGTLTLAGTYTTAFLNAAAFNWSGGTVNLTGTLDNTASTLTLGANTGSWNLSAATITGGTVGSTSSAGLIVTSSSTFSGVTMDAGVTVNSSQTLTVSGGLTLNGTITVNPATGSTSAFLTFASGVQMLSGTGQVALTGASNSTPTLRVASGGTLTIGPGLTIHGRGAIDSLGGGVLNNQGMIVAEVSGQALVITALSTWTNTGSLGTNGGPLTLAGTYTTAFLNAAAFSRTGGAVNLGGTLDNTAATLTLGANTGDWNLAAGTITGGTVESTGSAGLIVTTSSTLSGVTMNAGVTVNSTQTLTVSNGLTLNGTITVNPASGSTTAFLTFASGVQTLSGMGQVALTGASNSTATFRVASGGTLTVGPGITIHGRGAIDSLGGGLLNNQGTILADASSLVITGLSTWTSTGSLGTNLGTLTLAGTYTTAFLNAGSFSRNLGTVNLSGTLNNAAATLTLGANTGDWNVAGNGTVLGGTVESTSTARLVVTGGTTLSGVTMNANVTVTDGQTLTISNGLTLNGAITLSPASGSASNVDFAAGTQSLLGTGSIVLAGTGTAAPQVRVGIGGATTLTVAPGITIHGRGVISQLTAGSVLNNQGTIVADVSGQTLTITATSAWTNTGSFGTNLGTLTVGGTYTTAFLNAAAFSRNGGTVNLTGTLDNAAATLMLGANTGDWNLSVGATIVGGTVDSTSTARLIVTSSSAVLSGVTLNAGLRVADAQTLTIRNGLTLNGTIDVNPTVGGSLATVQFGSGVQTLSGTGDVQLRTATSATPRFQLGGDPDPTILTIGPGITVHGGGAIGLTTSGSVLNNQGTILADASGQTLTITPASNWMNTGVLGTANGGSLTFAGTYTTVFLNAGSFNRGGAGTVNLTGTLDNTAATLTLGANTGDWILAGTMTGGTVSSTSSARIVTGTGSPTLSGVTMNANVTIDAGRTLRITNGLVLNGVVTLSGSAGSGATLQFQPGTQTLGGSGQVATATSGINTFSVTSGASVTIGPGVLVAGAMTISLSGPLVNQGTIVANASTGGNLTIGGAGSWTNEGTVSATNSRTLSVSLPTNYNSGTNTLTGGTWQVGTGSTLTMTGGVIRTLAAGTSVSLTGSTSTFAAISTLTTNAGTLTLANGRAFNFTPTGNVFANSGTFIKSGTGTSTVGPTITFNNSGSVEVQGGTLAINGGGTHTGSFVLSGGGVLSLSGTHVVSGTGITGTGTVINTGILRKLGIGTFAIATGVTLDNPGTVESLAGTLVVGGPIVQVVGGALSAGVWRADGGILDVSGGSITVNNANLVVSGTSSDILGLNNIQLNNGSILIDDHTFPFTPATGVFTNPGHVDFDGGGVITIPAGVTFNNTGNSVGVGSGTTVIFAGGGTHTGHFVMDPGCTLVFLGGHTFTNTAQITGGGNVEFADSVNAFAGLMSITGGLWVDLPASLTLSGTTAVGYLENAGTTSFSGGVHTLAAAGITSSGTLTIGGDVTIPSGVSLSGAVSVQTGGTLRSGSLTFTGSMNWTGGAVVMTGTLTVAPGAGLTMGPGSMSLTGGMDDNTINGNWTGGGLSVLGGVFRVGSGASLTASGTGSITGTGQFENQGVLVCAGSLTIGANYHDTGGAGVQVGTGGSLTFAGASNMTSATIANSGTITVSGLVTFDRTQSIGGTLAITSNGTMAGAATITLTGALNWSGGAMSGTGTTNVGAGGAMSLSGGAHTLSRTLNHYSINGNWTGGGLSVFNGIFNNQAGASLTVNPGTGNSISVTEGGGTNQFNNHGLITVLTGTFTIGVGGSNDGTINVIAPDTLRFTVGYTHLAGSMLTGPGSVEFAGGMHSFPSGGFAVSGAVRLTTGTLVLAASDLPNYNTTTHVFSGGAWTVGAGASLYLNGADIWTIAANTSFTVNAGGTFDGLDHLSSVIGSLSIGQGRTLAVTPNGGTLTSSGAITLADGSQLSITGNYSQTATGVLSTTLAGTGASQMGRLTVSGTAALGGGLAVSYASGFVPVRSNSFDFLSAGSVGGQFASTNLPTAPSGLKSAVIYSATGVRVLVTARADWNNDGVVSIPDIFAYLTSWFIGESGTDWNGDGQRDVADIFSFLTTWFQG